MGSLITKRLIKPMKRPNPPAERYAARHPNDFVVYRNYAADDEPRYVPAARTELAVVLKFEGK